MKPLSDRKIDRMEKFYLKAYEVVTDKIGGFSFHSGTEWYAEQAEVLAKEMIDVFEEWERREEGIKRDQLLRFFAVQSDAEKYMNEEHEANDNVVNINRDEGEE